MKNLSSYEIHYRIVRPDNSIRYIREEGSVLATHDGQGYKILGVLLDITELTEARMEAERASDAKSNFLANLSHELRTPLNAIIGFGELLQLGLKKENSEEYGGLIKKSGHHLLSLINDILDLSKISAGKWTLYEKPISLKTVALSCTDLMEGNSDATGRKLTIDMPDDLPQILADERSIRQILIKLVSNAAKHTPLGGKITFFAKLLPDGELSFGVADTGAGIDEEDQEKVFEVFSQAERDASRAANGTGLGLPIVKALAAAHGGAIKLWSRVGEGTRVEIVFPSERVLHGLHGHAPSAA